MTDFGAPTATIPQLMAHATARTQAPPARFRPHPPPTQPARKGRHNSPRLKYTADLHRLQPVLNKEGQAAIQLEWGTTIKNNALGIEFDPTSITEAILGHYTQSPTELETKFLDLELNATAC